jgi:hypothetical protein
MDDGPLSIIYDEISAHAHQPPRTIERLEHGFDSKLAFQFVYRLFHKIHRTFESGCIEGEFGVGSLE